MLTIESLLAQARARPPLRSSAIKVIGDPFNYFLTERLGITSAFSASDRLVHGSYIHEALRMVYLSPYEREVHVLQKMQEIQEEHKYNASLFSLTPDTRAQILSTEEFRAKTALSFFEAASQVKRPGTSFSDGFISFLRDPKYEVVGRELIVILFPWGKTSPPLVAQYDLLLYERSKNLLHVVDLKSTSSLTRHRAAYANKEFQTLHYLHILNEAIKLGLFADRIDGRPSVGSMAHLIIQTPSIHLGGNDRDFQLISEPYKRGPKKGQPKPPTKKYSGEPKLSNFLARTVDWYLGRNDYANRALLVLGNDSPVNISWTPYNSITKQDWEDYLYWLSELRRWATTAVDPKSYPKNMSNLMYTTWSDESVYLDFYQTDPQLWPEAMRRHRLITRHRNPEIDLVMEPMLLETT